MATPQETIDAANALNESLKTLVATMKDISEGKGLGDIGKTLYEYNTNLKEYLNTGRDLIKQEKDKVLYSQEYQTLQDAIKQGAIARRDLGEQTNKLDKLRFDLQYNLNNITQQQVDTQQLVVERLNQTLSTYEDIITGQNTLQQNLSLEEKEQLKLYLLNTSKKEQLLDYLKNHRDLFNAIKNVTTEEERQKAINEYINQLYKQGLENIKSQSDVWKGLVKLGDDFKTKLGLSKITLTGILDAAFSLNKAFVETGKQLGIGSRGAKQLADSYAYAGASAGTLASYGTSIVQNQKNLLQASNDVNKELGTSAILSKERLQDQVSLTKEMGFTVEEATKIQRLSLLSGYSNKQIQDSVNNQVLALGKQQGIYLDNRKVTADVAKISGQISAQYKNNPELLAQAVVETAKIGTNLQDAAAAADQLLNFETSIQNELKAELLTGKAINLETARELALRGDAAGAAKELRNQIGSLSEFQQLNVIQQRALAESIGTTADKLTEQLKLEELLVQTGDKNVAVLNERRKAMISNGEEQEFYADLRRANTSDELIAQQMELAAQDKMNLAVDKLLETFGAIAEGPLVWMIDKLTSIVDLVGGFKNLVGIIGGIMTFKIVTGIMTSVGQMVALNAQLGIQKAQLLTQIPIYQTLGLLTQEQAAAAIVSAEAMSLGAATPFIIGGIAAVAAFAGLSGMFSGGGGCEGGYQEPTNTNNRTTASNNTQQPIVVKIDNQFNVNNRGIATISTSQQQSQDSNRA